METRRSPDCEKIAGHLVAYLDGELPEPLEGEVREHLASCVDCEHEAKLLRESWLLLDHYPGAEASAGFTMDVLERADLSSRSTFFRKYRPMIAAAAVFLILVCGMWLVRRPSGTIDREMEIVHNLDLLEDLDFLEELGEDVEFLEMSNLEEEWY